MIDDAKEVVGAAVPKLIASYFTLAGDLIPFAAADPSPWDLRPRAEAAARAGFVGMGIETNDLRHNVARYGYGGIRRILADAGLHYLEFEVLTDWFADGERRARSDCDREFLLRSAGELGANMIKTVGDIHLATGSADLGQWPITALGDAYGQLCRDAARSGTRITLEIVPFSGIATLERAQELVEHASEPNGGILIDIWHMARGHIPYEDILSLPPHLITAVEIDDAMRQAVPDIFEDTICWRKLPGEGELDVPGFLRCIAETGYDGVYGVEIVSNEHRSRTLTDAAERAFETTISQFAKIDSLEPGA